MQTLPNLNYFAKDSTYLIDIIDRRVMIIKFL